MLFIIPLSFHFSNFYSLYKYYCLYSYIMISFNKHFTRLLHPENLLFFFVFDYSCDDMWLQWKSLFWAIMLFSASTYSFLENTAKMHVMAWFGFTIYNLLFLLDKLDLKDEVSKIISRNKYYWGEGEGKCILVHAGH